MFQLLTQIGLLVLIAAIACTQLYLLFKYLAVRGTLRRMQETSSGDHSQYKNGAARKRNGNGK
ncbi:MAG: hypothetical protein WCP22_08875 [Chlamydiota bacterium]